MKIIGDEHDQTPTAAANLELGSNSDYEDFSSNNDEEEEEGIINNKNNEFVGFCTADDDDDDDDDEEEEEEDGDEEEDYDDEEYGDQTSRFEEFYDALSQTSFNLSTNTCDIERASFSTDANATTNSSSIDSPSGSRANQSHKTPANNEQLMKERRDKLKSVGGGGGGEGMYVETNRSSKKTPITSLAPPPSLLATATVATNKAKEKLEFTLLLTSSPANNRGVTTATQPTEAKHSNSRLLSRVDTLIIVVHGGNVTCTDTSKQSDFINFKTTLETIMRANYGGGSRIAYRLVACGQICKEALIKLAT